MPRSCRAGGSCGCSTRTSSALRSRSRCWGPTANRPSAAHGTTTPGPKAREPRFLPSPRGGEGSKTLAEALTMRTLLLTVGLLAVLGVARMSLFTVDPTEFAYVTQFG